MCRWLLVRLAAMLPVVLSWGCARGESVEQGRGDSGSDASTDGSRRRHRSRMDRRMFVMEWYAMIRRKTRVRTRSI